MSGNPKEIAGSPNSMSINTDRLGGTLKGPGMQRIHGACYSNTPATCLHLSKLSHAHMSANVVLATNNPI